jgi:hypothetical protein
MTAIGIILLILGSFMIAVPLIRSESERSSYSFKPTGRRDDAEIMQVVGHMLKPIFWTNRKLFIAGALAEIIGLIVLIIL